MIAYNTAVLYGGGDGTLTDYLWIKNNVDTQDQINATLGYTYRPEWDDTTILLANFDNTLNAGNIASLTDDVLYWQIYRNVPNSPTLEFIARIPASQNKIEDFCVVNGGQYKYTIFAETESYISAPMTQLDYTTAQWQDWSLVGLTESDTQGVYYANMNNIWLFNSNLTSGTFTQNLAKNQIETFTQFPKVYSGKSNYISMEITALLGNINLSNGEYQGDTSTNIRKFRDFIADGNPKLLRDRKGGGWIVATMTNNFDINDVTSEQLTSVTFGVMQLDTLEDVSIIGVGAGV